MIRRFLATASVLGVLAFCWVALSTPASAAPYPPNTSSATLSASAYDPCAGASNVLGGDGFRPGETVRLVLGGSGEIGRPGVDADGSFSITVTIPLDARGNEVVTATGLTSRLTASINLDVPCVLGQDATALGGDNGNGDGGLAYTGVAIGGALLLAAGLISVGGAVLVAGRRRRGTSALG